MGRKSGEDIIAGLPKKVGARCVRVEVLLKGTEECVGREGRQNRAKGRSGRLGAFRNREREKMREERVWWEAARKMSDGRKGGVENPRIIAQPLRMASINRR